MMIPQGARGLIDEFAVQGGVLFDPYCGSGTSLVEGRLAKMNVVGTDLNPTARMIARTKAMSHDLSILEQDAALVLNDLEDALEAETDFTRFPEPNSSRMRGFWIGFLRRPLLTSNLFCSEFPTLPRHRKISFS